jgi:hypothetical protein
MPKLIDEINYLNRRFRLKTKIIVDKAPFRNNEDQAVYDIDKDQIILRNLKYSHEQLWYVLHELKHALQAKAGTIYRTKVRYYSQEIEAELFAAHYCEKIYGIRKMFWDLASYEHYIKLRFNKKGRIKSRSSPDEFLNRFRHLIEPETMKSIDKLLKSTNKMRLRKNPTCERGNKIILI